VRAYVRACVRAFACAWWVYFFVPRVGVWVGMAGGTSSRVNPTLYTSVAYVQPCTTLPSAHVDPYRTRVLAYVQPCTRFPSAHLAPYRTRVPDFKDHVLCCLLRVAGCLSPSPIGYRLPPGSKLVQGGATSVSRRCAWLIAAGAAVQPCLRHVATCPTASTRLPSTP
jgi:hypothetical protein